MKLEGKSLVGDFFRFIIPSIIAQWVFALYTMIDGIFVAKGVSEIALTAVNLSIPYVTTLFAISILFAVGTSTVVAIFLGEGKKEKGNQIFTQNMIAMLLLSLVITVLVLLNVEGFARFLGATDLTMPFVKQYLIGVTPFAVCFILSYCFETLIKTDGYPQLATIIVICGAVLNCILDYVFVIVLKKGVMGAAVATGMSQTAVILLYLMHFLGKKATIRFCKFKPDLPVIWRIMKNGISSGVTEFSAGIVIFFYNQAILFYLNEQALVSYTIISYINSIVVMCMAGIAQGFQPLLSYYYGKGVFENCKKLLRYGLLTAAAMSTALFLFSEAGAGLIVSLFVSAKETELMETSVTVFRIFAFSFLFAGINVVLAGYFTAIEKPVAAMTISIARGIVLVGGVLFIVTYIFGGSAIWWSTILSEGICLLLSLFFLKKAK